MLPDIFDQIKELKDRIAVIEKFAKVNGSQIVPGSITSNEISADILSGWTPLAGTFTYASATTITTSVDLTSVLRKGDKIKLNNTTVKYFYVTAITSTLMTVKAGTTYTIANLDITNVFYSKIENPQGFPEYFTYTPTFVGISSPVYTGQVGKFTIDGSFVNLYVSIRVSSYASPSGRLRISPPITGSLTIPSWGVCGYYRAGGSAYDGFTGVGINDLDNATVCLFRNTDSADACPWEASADTALTLNLRYYY